MAVRLFLGLPVHALCHCTIDFPAEAIFTLMRHETVCHIIPVPVFLLLVSNPVHVFRVWGAGGKGSDTSWLEDGRKEACFGQWAAAAAFIKMA